jgi:hypothetical protein
MRKTAQTRAKKKDPLTAKQRAFLGALAECNFNVTTACQTARIGRRTFYDWREKKPAFFEALEDVMEARIDIAEACLHKNIKAGDSTSIIFFLKTKGKERGYVEKETSSVKVAKILEEVLTGSLTVREAAYKIGSMGLPLPEVLKIELSKQESEPPPLPDAITPEELDERAREAIEFVENQRDHFVPQRREEVAELKDRLREQESFMEGDGRLHEG